VKVRRGLGGRGREANGRVPFVCIAHKKCTASLEVEQPLLRNPSEN
jgi:hypothetical protein